RLERGAPHRLSVPAGPGTIRVERGEERQIHRAHDSRVLERCSHGQDQRPGLVQDDQVRAGCGKQPVSTRAGPGLVLPVQRHLAPHLAPVSCTVPALGWPWAPAPRRFLFL
ncbi:unnamed protein product, partial [Gulo gulo]